MITTYFDKGCKKLNSSQNLNLRNDCSALWFCVAKGTDPSRFLRFMASTLSSFRGYFWLAFSGGAGSPKVLELKRSFGHWSIPKADVVSRYDVMDENGNKLYSDIAQISDENIEKLAKIFNRSLFGIDSAVFFLPFGVSMPLNNIAKPLADLMVDRNAMTKIDESLLNKGLLEGFIDEIVSMDGVATVTLRDSNMSTMVAAVGNQFLLSRIVKLMEDNSPAVLWKHIGNEAEFDQLLNVGVSVTVFS